MVIAYAVGSRIVFIAVLLAFLISWLAYIPAYLFQTEKFYDLTGSIKYLLLTWFIYILSHELYGYSSGNLILASLISIWTIRLGSFLFMRIHKDGEDKRFRTIKTSASQFFFTWTLSGMWVSLCSICAWTAMANPSGVMMNLITYIGISLFIIGFSIEIIADHQKTVFRSQMQIAMDIKKPIIFHNRNADKDMISVLNEFPEVNGIAHCFSSTLETAQSFLEQGYYISFSGNLQSAWDKTPAAI